MNPSEGNDKNKLKSHGTLDIQLAMLEQRVEVLDDRVTKHKLDFNYRIEKITDVLEKIEKILWQDGLVAAVKGNSQYITSQRNKKDDVIGAVYKVAITIILGYIAYKVGLKP